MVWMSKLHGALCREPVSLTQTDVKCVYLTVFVFVFDVLQYQAQRDYEACHSDFEEIALTRK